jgi:hypothetical protein
MKRKLRHGGILNALAMVGLQPEADPNDPCAFHVTADEIIGRWSKNSEGAVAVAITEENDQVKGHANVRAFLAELTKKKRADSRKIMH